MEHLSCKSHVVDMNIAGTDVINFYWDEGKQNIFHFAYFYHPCHCGLVRGQTHMVPCGTGIIVIPVDFYCVTCVCISSEPRVIYLRASSSLELKCISIYCCIFIVCMHVCREMSILLAN